MITVFSNQSLIDIAIQESGSALAVIDWAVANGLSITEPLVPGKQLHIPVTSKGNTEVAIYLQNKQQKVATTYEDIQETNPLRYVFAYELPVTL